MKEDLIMDKQVQDTFWKAFADSPVIMMRLEGAGSHAEPMTAQLDPEAQHEFWFFTTRDNRIGKGGRAMGQIMTRGHDVFACLSGTLVEETDRARWDKHWDRYANAWFPGGRNDPNVIMLRFEIDDAEVWTADPSIKGRLKLLAGKAMEPRDAGKHSVGAV